MASPCAFCSETSVAACARCRRDVCAFHRPPSVMQRCPHRELQWNEPNRGRELTRVVASVIAGIFGAMGAVGLAQLAIARALLGDAALVLLVLPIAMTIGTYRWVDQNVFRRRFLKESVHALPTAKIVGRLG